MIAVSYTTGYLNSPVVRQWISLESLQSGYIPVNQLNRQLNSDKDNVSLKYHFVHSFYILFCHPKALRHSWMTSPWKEVLQWLVQQMAWIYLQKSSLQMVIISNSKLQQLPDNNNMITMIIILMIYKYVQQVYVKYIKINPKCTQYSIAMIAERVRSIKKKKG